MKIYDEPAPKKIRLVKPKIQRDRSTPTVKRFYNSGDKTPNTFSDVGSSTFKPKAKEISDYPKNNILPLNLTSKSVTRSNSLPRSTLSTTRTFFNYNKSISSLKTVRFVDNI